MSKMFKMNTMKKMALTAMALAAIATNAAPEKKRITLKFNHEQFKQESVIKLKREIKKLHPNMDFSKFDLKRVVLLAKSKKGKAEAYLKIGQYESAVESIDGNQFDFSSNQGYSPVVFQSFSENDNGVWQIHMKGNIKVKRINLVAEKKVEMVTKSCSFQFETVWGKDIKKFSASATGPKGSGVQAEACQKAKQKCKDLQSEVPLTQCTKL